MHRAAPALNVRGADDVVRLPVAAFHEHVRPCAAYELERRSFVEPRDEAYGLECRDHRGSVFQGIHRPIVTLTQPAHGRVGIERNNQRSTELPCLCEVGRMAAVEHVEDAIREDEWPLNGCNAPVQLGGRTELALEAWGRVDLPVRWKAHRTFDQP